MRGLTVLGVGYPFAPVSGDATGGAEQVLAAIDAALVRQGHRSIVIAAEGSKVAGELFTLPRFAGPITDRVRREMHEGVRAAIEQVVRRRAVDVVHLHGIDFAAYLPPPGPLALATLHLPPSWYPQAALRPVRPGTFLHGVSQSQDAVLRRLASPRIVLPPVPNGVPVEALGGAHHARRGFALTLGRICPEKGQHFALQAARAAGIPLLIAGEVFPYREHVAYFRRQIVPLLDRRRRFIGAAGFARKRRLLSAARCVLIPSTVPETSSLVAMEAAACGTPVIAFRSGALPETVRDGVTGFVVDDVAGMTNAIGRTQRIAPETCRRIARERFDVARMTATYIGRYRQLAGLAAAA